MKNMIPFAFMKTVAGSIITPSDGALDIPTGQTVDIAEGGVYQYESINIASGGTLRITGNTGAWTEIGVAGDCVINGTIISRAGYAGQQTHSGGTFTKESVFGLGSLAYTIVQKLGARGGDGAGPYFHKWGGPQSSGIGGGGGGGGTIDGDMWSTSARNATVGGTGVAGSLGAGGNGGNAQGNASSTILGSSNGKAGGSGGGGAGGRGVSASYTDGDWVSKSVHGAGGGGGGYKGRHGKGLVLYVEGNISGTGTIECSGESGYKGGNGGAAAYNAGLGGRGGGGAGGSGGKLILRYSSGAVPNISISGGAAGANGTGNGTSGGVAEAGDDGESDVATI